MKTALKLGQKGQSSVEYLLIVAILVVAIFAFGGRLQKGLSELTDNVFQKMGSKVGEKINDAK